MIKSKIDELFDFAISEEEKAADFYASLAEKMKKPAMASVFLEFAEEEKQHKARLLRVKENWITQTPHDKIASLAIADYVVDITPSADMDYQQALQLAMSKEKAAFKMYSEMAYRTTDPDARKVFLLMAQEEAKHKLRFELEYEDVFLQEN
jgi:rubrerythrin